MRRARCSGTIARGEDYPTIENVDAAERGSSDMGAELATVGLALLLVASISRRLSGSPVTPAMVLVAIGVLAGPLLIDELTVAPTSATVRRLAEATLTAAGCDRATGHRRARGRSRS
jgi:hypothetical protein